jgi:hypothetical protein
MNIESLIKRAFERDVEQYRTETPPFPKRAAVFQDAGKRGKEPHGFFIASLIIAVLLSVFSLRTGLFESSLVFPWDALVKRLPENPPEAFLHFLQAINSSV